MVAASLQFDPARPSLVRCAAARVRREVDHSLENPLLRWASRTCLARNLETIQCYRHTGAANKVSFVRNGCDSSLKVRRSSCANNIVGLIFDLPRLFKQSRVGWGGYQGSADRVHELKTRNSCCRHPKECLDFVLCSLLGRRKSELRAYLCPTQLY